MMTYVGGLVSMPQQQILFCWRDYLTFSSSAPTIMAPKGYRVSVTVVKDLEAQPFASITHVHCLEDRIYCFQLLCDL